MNWNVKIRQFHRWVSVLFTLVVAGIFVAISVGSEPPQWVYFLPLPPLFLLMATGLYLFALPYRARRRSGGPSAAE